MYQQCNGHVRQNVENKNNTTPASKKQTIAWASFRSSQSFADSRVTIGVGALRRPPWTSVENLSKYISNIYRTYTGHLSNIDRTSIGNLSHIYRTSVKRPSEIDQTSIAHLSNIYRTSFKHLSKTYRTYIEIVSSIYRTSSEHVLNLYGTSIEHLSSIYWAKPRLFSTTLLDLQLISNTCNVRLPNNTPSPIP